ncbi:unnamed protein product [Rhizopus stolonifer]
MAPTILVIGATGNTGQSVVYNLPKLLELKDSKYRILGLTRSLDNPASKKLASLPLVEMQEKDWTTIDAEWLKEQDVVRVYVAPHNLIHQFVDESALYVALLHARVKYVVKVSTNLDFIGPTSPVFYGRTHWAIENMLSQPEFKDLQWTSLRPNIFTGACLSSAASWISQYKNTGKQETLEVVLDADIPAAMIDPQDVGIIGAHLLALEDPTPHNQAKYVLSGPQDINGKQIVEMVEQHVGVKVQNVEFKSTTPFNAVITAGIYPEKYFSSLVAGTLGLWKNRCSLSGTPTSKEIIELAPPNHTAAEAFKAMLE